MHEMSIEFQMGTLKLKLCLCLKSSMYLNFEIFLGDFYIFVCQTWICLMFVLEYLILLKYLALPLF